MTENNHDGGQDEAERHRKAGDNTEPRRRDAGQYEMPEDLRSELEAVLAEAEATVAELRKELAEQRRLREQHEEVEKLDEHLARTKVRWEEVKVFFEEALNELRRSKDDEPQTPASAQASDKEENNG